MPPSRSRFITACQQMLALGVVLAVLTPAARVITLDVVREVPPASPGVSPTGSQTAAGTALAAPSAYTTSTGPGSGASAYARRSAQASRVASGVAEPVVHEIPLTAPTGARVAAGSLKARTAASADGGTELTSLPQPVTGYGAVGVTWQHGENLAEDAITFDVRTATGGVWSDWSAMEYHDDHGPDPDSAEARKARPGTDEAIVGNVDQVQVRSTAAALPADMKLAVIDPGTTTTATERPAIQAEDAPTTSKEGVLLRAAVLSAPQPTIYSRAQWGADESMRNASALRYGSIAGGFVHHTVNANDYTRAQVPALLRSIYAYHTKSRGWSDIGYNFLVDRFGRIWEGRYGGVDKPVVGAHTLGYNDYSFAMSAIGNYDIAAPSEAIIQAYGALFAWKLSISGVDAASTRQKIGSSYFNAISGHRDAGSTACPGQYLYARLGDIRTLAKAAQSGAPVPTTPTPVPATWTGRNLGSNLASTPSPDVVVRRTSDQMAVILPTGGTTAFSNASVVSKKFARSSTVVASPDLTGDGVSDLLVISGDGTAKVRRGKGGNDFGTALKKTTKVFAGHDLITAVGDLDRDGHNDFVGRLAGTGQLDVFLGGGKGGFTRKALGNGWQGYTAIVATGDVTGDGKADIMGKDKSGKLRLFRGTGSAKLAKGAKVPGSWAAYGSIVGFGDFTNDGHNDLLVRRAGNQQTFLRPGRGDGSFGPKVGPFSQFKGVTAITGGGSINGGPAADVLARKGKRLVSFTNSDGFDLGAPVETGLSLADSSAVINAGDWDLDGLGDLITRDTATGALSVRRGDGQGHFGEPTRIGEGFAGVTQLAAVGDLNGDSWPDLIGIAPGGTAMSLWPGHGTGALGAPITSPDTGVAAGAAALGLDLSAYDWLVEVSDLDGDGKTDMIVRRAGNGRLYSLRSASGYAAHYLGEGMRDYDLVG